jgi:hypothetical protein
MMKDACARAESMIFSDPVARMLRSRHLARSNCGAAWRRAVLQGDALKMIRARDRRA